MASKELEEALPLSKDKKVEQAAELIKGWMIAIDAHFTDLCEREIERDANMSVFREEVEFEKIGINAYASILLEYLVKKRAGDIVQDFKLMYAGTKRGAVLKYSMGGNWHIEFEEGYPAKEEEQKKAAIMLAAMLKYLKFKKVDKEKIMAVFGPMIMKVYEMDDQLYFVSMDLRSPWSNTSVIPFGKKKASDRAPAR